MIIDGVERYRDIVPDWQGFLETLNRPLPLCIWTNTLRSTDEQILEHLARLKINAVPLTWRTHAFRAAPHEMAGRSLAFLSGLYHIQEEVSMLPVALLDPQPGERILDLCAAPGNKTAQAAVAMANSGTIVANDRSSVRMRASRGTLDRLGIVNTTITSTDATVFPAEAGYFDKVLADVPCTCEGTSRKHPGAFLQSGVARSKGLQQVQTRILTKAVELCRPGGRIVYATCTYAPEENEEVVDSVLARFAGEVDVLPASIPGMRIAPGTTWWNGRALHPSLERTIRIWPHLNDTGGFFCAVLQKYGGDSFEHGDAGRRGATNAANESDRRVDGAGSRTRTEFPGDRSVDRDSRKVWTDLLASRFGIQPEVLEQFRFLEPNNKYVAAVCHDHDRISAPEPVSVGMPLIRVGLKHPKLTTAGARLIGHHAEKNVVDATEAQSAVYLDRRPFKLDPHQRRGVSGTGYVIVRHAGVVLGIGLYFEDEDRVGSLFPKVLSRAYRATPEGAHQAGPD